MSIYRRAGATPGFDLHTQTESRVNAKSTPEFDWAKWRMSEPVSGLLKPTFTWAATLPVDIQPRALLYKFPRIANLIAAMWPDPNSLRGYVDDLLVDKRGTRHGFPLEVLRELFLLRDYYDQLHPDTSAPWDTIVTKG